jgi:RNA polymerase sigma-70 factor (sigma-E family)
MQPDDSAEFEQFVVARQTHWLRTAFMLSGQWHAAEDLVQSVLERLYVSWPRVVSASSPDAYVRRSLVNAFLSERRRPWRREHAVPDAAADVVTPGDPVDDRLLLAQALRSVPPRQRTALVLRYWEDLSVDETAELMRCAPGTVKSQTAAGLKALRAELTHLAYEECAP